LAGPTAAAHEQRSDDIAQLADGISRLMRSFNRAKDQLAAAAEHDVEWSAHLLLANLVIEGPLRAGALAELVQSDPSTVSRQVAGLVKDGLIERRADPVDGRASLLIATAQGESAVRAHKEVRNAHFRRMLSDWSEPDCRQFAVLLQRFTAAFDSYRPAYFAGERGAHRATTSVTRGES
jgi:DNA-binding MarR family transcriptional regulator